MTVSAVASPVAAAPRLVQRAAALRYAAAAFVVPLTLYAFSLSAAPASWDTAELQGVPYLLGIAHPTGFPLFILAGWLFTHVVAVSSVAYRMNLFCAICGAFAALALYDVARELRIPRFIALLCAWYFALTNPVWTHAIRAEAHDLALALSAFSVLFAVRFIGQGDVRRFYAAALFCGLALATHPIAVWLLPGLVVCAAVAKARPTRRQLAASAGIVAACLLFYAYLPLRSWYIVTHHLDPTASLQGVSGGLFWNLGDPSSRNGFFQTVSGSKFGAGSSALSAINFDRLQGDAAAWLTNAATAYGAYALLLAIVGVPALWRRNSRATLVLLVMGLAAVPFSYAYAGIESDTERYRLLSYWTLAVLLGGVSAEAAARRHWLTTVAIAAFLMWSVQQTFSNNVSLLQNRFNAGSSSLVRDVAARVPNGAVIEAPWLDATSLAYAAYVDGELKTRAVVSAWPDEYANDEAAWSRVRPVYVLGPANIVVPGVRLSPPIPVDASHWLYRVLGAAGRSPRRLAEPRSAVAAHRSR